MNLTSARRLFAPALLVLGLLSFSLVAAPPGGADDNASLSWTIVVEPQQPRVGEPLQVRAFATGVGGIPGYTLIPEPGGWETLRLDSDPQVVRSMLADEVAWDLTPIGIGDIELSIELLYEKPFVFCPDPDQPDDCLLGFRFEVAESPQIPITVRSAYGDVNCDVAINSIDAALLLQLDAALIAQLACDYSADVTGDGAVNSIDSSVILQYVAGLVDELGGP